MASEPAALAWVFHRALGRDIGFPPAEAWRSGLRALQASRLTALAAHLVLPYSDALPPDLALHFEAARLMGDSLAERGREQLADAAGRMRPLGIPWLVLKGWPLASRLYATPGQRPSGDLDLLVRPEDLPVAVAAFESGGYRTEGDDRDHHVRLVRQAVPGNAMVLELHHRAGPPRLAAPAAGELLARRVRYESSAGEVWIPSREDEADLLVRHYLRHAGNQAILLLDILKLLGNERFAHPAGSLIADDLGRLGVERTVDGPVRWSHWPLRRWMSKRTFEERRGERHAALAGVPLALGRSPGAKIVALFRVLWPERPTPRWASAAKAGGMTWRLRRAARLGR